ncbi:MAG: aminotransferase class V-fold PLP-dependent enzyme [Planctomycetota bacterium]|nr:MAG: aminotransferase class V-fold PLP-dependent enzyme [Planctomycetota bacterium]
MSLGAQHALSEFHSLAGDIGCCMYFEEFLEHGFTAARDDLPVLRTWRGISGLKRRLKDFVGNEQTSGLLLANRSSQLMTVAAHLLAERCRNVLITDLTWPAYARILRRVATVSGGRVTCVPLRRRIFSDRLSVADICDVIQSVIESSGCDGLFVPLIDNLGIRFPLADCAGRMRASGQLQFVVADGAQTLGHVPLRLAQLPCDFLMAGCHKWLRAYQPLGLGFFGRPKTLPSIERTLTSLIAAGEVDDPLLQFTVQQTMESRRSFTETVNLSPLFSCHGALLEVEQSCRGLDSRGNDRHQTLHELTDGSPWRPVLTDQSVRTQIAMLQRKSANGASAEQIRRQFAESGVALTAYSNNTLRLSLPFAILTSIQKRQLASAFRCT